MGPPATVSLQVPVKLGGVLPHHEGAWVLVTTWRMVPYPADSEPYSWNALSGSKNDQVPLASPANAPVKGAQVWLAPHSFGSMGSGMRTWKDVAPVTYCRRPWMPILSCGVR